MSVLIEKKKRVRKEFPGDGKSHPGRRMTEAEFAAWCDEWTRAEWVDGEVIMMDDVTGEHDEIHHSVKSGMDGVADAFDLGVIRGDNFPIRLASQRRRRYPDLLFVAKHRLHILQGTSCEGAPDMVVEIVSQDSTERDWREKFLEYEKAGVREYWIIDPLSKCLEAYELVGRKYKKIAEVDGKLCSKVLKGFHLRRAWLLRARFPSMMTLLKELKLVK